MRKIFWFTFTLGAFFTVLCSVLGFWGDQNWLLDMMSHFRMQYMIVLLVASFTLWFWRRWIALSLIPFILLNTYSVGQLYMGSDNRESQYVLKILCINVLSYNTQYEKVRDLIVNEDPDIVILQEFRMSWQTNLASTMKRYPVQLEVPQVGNFGMALYSRQQINQLRSIQLGKAGVISIIGELKLQGHEMNIIATHPLPPVGQEQFDYRNNQLRALEQYIQASNKDVILLGDLNTSSFSAHFQRLVQGANLKDSRKGFGLLSSWPARVKVMQVTLDHCLVSPDIQVVDRRVGPYVGSDHLPVIVELGY